jgi:uncharacterized protein YdbL (DUF1318 family)
MTCVRTSAAARPTWLALLALAGCVAVTINVTFPQEKIDSAASSIEDLVTDPAAPPAEQTKPGPRSDERETPMPRASADPTGPAARALGRWATWLGPARAEAQTPDIKTRTPQVMAVIESRRARYPEVAAALTKGCVGENNRGLLEARPGTDCPQTVGALVEAENRDRMTLYHTIIEQNNMPPGDLGRVQTGFARAHRERAPAGAWVQDEAGGWSRK